MRKFIVSLFTALFFITFFSISAHAQVCSTGHFVFDVPDSWKFRIYEGFITYDGSNESIFFAQENDIRYLGSIQPEQLVHLYRSCNSEGTLIQVGDDIAYYYFEDDVSSYPSLKYYNYCTVLMFYKNGYLLHLVYYTNSPVTKKECATTIEKIADSLSYSVQKRSTYDSPKE